MKQNFYLFFSYSKKRVYIDLKDSKGYADVLKKVRIDNSNLLLHINLICGTIKNEIASFWALSGRILIKCKNNEK